MKLALLISGIAGVVGVRGAEPAVVTQPPNPENTLAWIRFVAGPERYQEVPYYWLGRGDLRGHFAVTPQPGLTLELLWGAKNDERGAHLTVNGQSQVVGAGGYDGFRWLRVPVVVAGNWTNCQVALTATSGRPAFLAEMRLTGEAPAAERPDLTAPSHLAKVIQIPGDASPPRGDAFPAMRAVWDAEPAASTAARGDPVQAALFRQAEKNGRRANEAFYRCRRFIDGWLAQADPATGLIPRNLTSSRDFWNGRDAGADNYPFMVLTASMTDRELLNGRLLDMLKTEIRLTSRVGRLTDDYSFSKQGYRRAQVDLEAIIFDSAEYVKDGLIPITEWMGPSPWSERMLGLMDDLWALAPIETPFGKLPTLNFEVGGDLLQAGSRLFWFTGQRKYLEWAARLGDYYLLGNQHPTRDLDSLRLNDHGCEVVNGLTELYVAVTHAWPEKRRAYAKPIHEMFDRILAVGRNEHGMLYRTFHPKTGQNSGNICDTWGYNYDGFYTVYLLDQTVAYRDATRQALASLQPHYTGFDWGGSDGYADSLEGAINLLNREPIATAAAYVDREIRTMWAIQKPDGVIEGWHGDGNFARTSLMYALWKTAGVTVQPWRADVRFGAVQAGDRLYLSLQADQPWQGRVVFDQPRHRTIMRLPLDYPRINQFPEWFAVETGQRYSRRELAGGEPAVHSGQELQAGVSVALAAGQEQRWVVAPAK